MAGKDQDSTWNSLLNRCLIVKINFNFVRIINSTGTIVIHCPCIFFGVRRRNEFSLLSIASALLWLISAILAMASNESGGSSTRLHPYRCVQFRYKSRQAWYANNSFNGSLNGSISRNVSSFPCASSILARFASSPSAVLGHQIAIHGPRSSLLCHFPISSPFQRIQCIYFYTCLHSIHSQRARR